MADKKRFITEFEMEIDVVFEDHQKATAFFIDGDWKESFYTFTKLSQVSECLAQSFYDTDVTWDKYYRCSSKFVGSFGKFYNTYTGEYKLSKEFADVCGGITIICTTELEPVDTYEFIQAKCYGRP